MAKLFTITEGLENMGALKTGGQGSVYKGKRIGEIITAVKLLPTPIHSESEEDKNFIDFKNEVEKLKKVNEQSNPNVVKILSSGITETGNLPFIEMEFIEGPDLEELLKPPHQPVFTIKETLRVAEHLANALAHCHSVNVKHGDIKSNNVKFNIHSGNYVLLDFGLAVMSDEQRRTSLRHAGAIEFMAPEQNEGIMLFQTDVYSFGIILFELLAGVVPFPLKDKGETARNMVMVSHMESPVPDLLLLRKQNMPLAWSEEKKVREMQVPEWLIKTIYKCLEKKPALRFATGIELHDHIVQNSTSPVNKIEPAVHQLNSLQQENEKLRHEKEHFQNLSIQYRQAVDLKERELQALRTGLEDKERELYQFQARSRATMSNTAKRRSSWGKGFVLFLLLATGVSIFVYVWIKNRKGNQQISDNNIAAQQKPRSSIGQYKVMASRAYFHTEPNKNTRRNAYMVPSNDVVTALEEQNDFVYTEFTNSKGQTSKGWLSKNDLMPLEEWSKKGNDSKPIARLTKIDINLQLQEAKDLLANNQVKEAVDIYNYLAGQGVPEAMYEYGNLGLQRKHDLTDCKESFGWVKKASDKGYIPAKRTLGFLYLFADNREVLEINDYNQCQFDRNVYKGCKLLMEAVLEGDSTAQRLLNELDIKTPENKADTLKQGDPLYQ